MEKALGPFKYAQPAIARSPLQRLRPVALCPDQQSTDSQTDKNEAARLRDEGVRYVVVTGAVEDRVLAAARNYPRETRFYDGLRRQPRVYSIRPHDDVGGPWLEIYRL
jgi:hypothetical protein